MIARIQRWGNSQGVRISKALLNDTELSVGSEVEIAVVDGRIVLTPAQRVRGGHKLEELVSRIPDGVQVEEVDGGAPNGREEW